MSRKPLLYPTPEEASDSEETSSQLLAGDSQALLDDSMMDECKRVEKESATPRLKLNLMTHQVHGLCWMMQMEQIPNFGVNSLFWEERKFQDGIK